ncbi:hypothetical protein D3C86_1661850 [compost metagenome]
MLEVHQRHDPGQNGFSGARKHMHDQVRRQRAGDCEEPSQTAIDVVVDRTGGRQDRGGLSEGGCLGQHHDHRDQHGHRKSAAANSKTHRGRENDRAGHDQANGAG